MRQVRGRGVARSPDRMFAALDFRPLLHFAAMIVFPTATLFSLVCGGLCAAGCAKMQCIVAVLKPVSYLAYMSGSGERMKNFFLFCLPSQTRVWHFIGVSAGE